MKTGKFNTSDINYNYILFGQRPRWGTKSCRKGRFSVHLSVCPSPPSRAQEPARHAFDLARQASEPASQASEPAGQVSEPARQGLRPARLALEPSRGGNGWTDGWMDGRMGGWTNRQMDQKVASRGV